jgi:hypothetical protein
LGTYIFFISYHDDHVKRQAVKLGVVLNIYFLYVGLDHDQKMAVGIAGDNDFYGYWRFFSATSNCTDS